MPEDTAELDGIPATEEEIVVPKLEEKPVPIRGLLDKEDTVVVEVVEVEDTERGTLP